MKKNWQKIIGITDKMELHIHGNCNGEEFTTNINISKIMDLLEQFTYKIGDEKETKMLEHLRTYFYDKIIT